MGSGRQSVRDPLVPRYGPASAPGPLALVSDAPAGEGFVSASPLARARACVTPMAKGGGDRGCVSRETYTPAHCALGRFDPLPHLAGVPATPRGSGVAARNARF